MNVKVNANSGNPVDERDKTSNSKRNRVTNEMKMIANIEEQQRNNTFEVPSNKKYKVTPEPQNEDTDSIEKQSHIFFCGKEIREQAHRKAGLKHEHKKENPKQWVATKHGIYEKQVVVIHTKQFRDTQDPDANLVQTKPEQHSGDKIDWLTQMSSRLKKQSAVSGQLPNGKRRRISTSNPRSSITANASENQCRGRTMPNSSTQHFLFRQTIPPRAETVNIWGGNARPQLSEHPD